MLNGSRKWIIKLISCMACGFCLTILQGNGIGGALPAFVVGIVCLGWGWSSHTRFEYPPSKIPIELIAQFPTGELSKITPKGNGDSQRVACQIFDDSLVCHAMIGDKWRVYSPIYYRGNIEFYSVNVENSKVVLRIWTKKYEGVVLTFDERSDNIILVTKLQETLRTVNGKNYIEDSVSLEIQKCCQEWEGNEDELRNFLSQRLSEGSITKIQAETLFEKFRKNHAPANDTASCPHSSDAPAPNETSKPVSPVEEDGIPDMVKHCCEALQSNLSELKAFLNQQLASGTITYSQADMLFTKYGSTSASSPENNN